MRGKTRTIDARREGETKRDMPELKDARHTYWQYLPIYDACVFGRIVLLYREAVPPLGAVHLHHFRYNGAETDGGFDVHRSETETDAE